MVALKWQEFHWNLRLLLRNAHPDGLGIHLIEENYEVYFKTVVTPEEISTSTTTPSSSATTWVELLTGGKFRTHFTVVTDCDVPRVKLITPREESPRDLNLIFKHASYETVFGKERVDTGSDPIDIPSPSPLPLSIVKAEPVDPPSPRPSAQEPLLDFRQGNGSKEDSDDSCSGQSSVSSVQDGLGMTSRTQSVPTLTKFYTYIQNFSNQVEPTKDQKQRKDSAESTSSSTGTAEGHDITPYRGWRQFAQKLYKIFEGPFSLPSCLKENLNRMGVKGMLIDSNLQKKARVLEGCCYFDLPFEWIPTIPTSASCNRRVKDGSEDKNFLEFSKKWAACLVQNTYIHGLEPDYRGFFMSNSEGFTLFFDGSCWTLPYIEKGSHLELRLPPSSLVYGELVCRMRKKGYTEQLLFNVIDAAVLFGEDISSLPLKRRYQKIKSKLEAFSNHGQGILDRIEVRPRPIMFELKILEDEMRRYLTIKDGQAYLMCGSSRLLITGIIFIQKAPIFKEAFKKVYALNWMEASEDGITEVIQLIREYLF